MRQTFFYTLRCIAIAILPLPAVLIAGDNTGEKALLAMPSGQYVLQTITGADIQDANARQMAALRVLSEMVTMNRLVASKLQRGPLEAKLIKDYSLAMSKVSEQFRAAVPEADDPNADLKKRYMLYYNSPEFEKEVVHPLLGTNAQAALSDRQEMRRQQQVEEEAIVQQDSVDRSQSEERSSKARRQAIWAKSRSGLGMIGLGTFLLVIAITIMRSTKESGLAAVGFVLILASVVLIAAGLTEFGDLL